jgi:hypothetical protein
MPSQKLSTDNQHARYEGSPSLSLQLPSITPEYGEFGYQLGGQHGSSQEILDEVDGELCSSPATTPAADRGAGNKCNLLYGLTDKPPLHLSILLGLQVFNQLSVLFLYAHCYNTGYGKTSTLQCLKKCFSLNVALSRVLLYLNRCVTCSYNIYLIFCIKYTRFK